MAKHDGRTVAGALALCAALAATGANADSFAWSYSGVNSGPVVAGGTLQATALGGGAFSVTSIAGVRNGVAITGLTAYAGQDNEVFTVGSAVDYLGLAYTTVGGFAFNVFFDTITTDAYNCGQVGYCEIGPGVPGTSGLGPPRDSVGPIDVFTLTPIPEPATWALMIGGLGLVGVSLRRRSPAFAVLSGSLS